MAAEIEQRFPGTRVEMIPSRGGRFEVMADGKPVFEKSKVGRHAQPGEVVAALEQLR